MRRWAKRENATLYINLKKKKIDHRSKLPRKIKEIL